MIKLNRNEPCPCGSGIKYKKCCLQDNEKNHEIERASKLSNSKEEFYKRLNEGISIITLKVTLDHNKLQEIYDVWRKIQINSNQTLYDLHLIIQEAFNWDNDHMFSFFMTNVVWDKNDEYTANPVGEYYPSSFRDTSKSASNTELRDLNLIEGTEFKYLFDYGDELIHTIKIEKITIETMETKDYPIIIEKNGEAPEQYET